MRAARVCMRERGLHDVSILKFSLQGFAQPEDRLSEHRFYPLDTTSRAGALRALKLRLLFMAKERDLLRCCLRKPRQWLGSVPQIAINSPQRRHDR